MKKIFQLVLFSLLSYAAYSQPGSLSQSVIRYRVNDSTAAIAANVAAIAQGYSPMFWNNQAATPHWDIWTGAAYEHVFDFQQGAGGAAVWGGITGTLSSQTDLNTALGLKAPLASPTFTGTPAAPTAATTVNTTQLATMAAVQSRVLEAYTATGTNTYAVTVNGITAYAAGQVFDVKLPNTNTTREVFLNVNGLGNRAFFKNVNIFFTPGDLIPNQTYRVFDNGTNYQAVDHQLVQRIYNVEAYGAKHDYQTNASANITSGTATLTCASCSFTSNDTGKTYRAFGAGAAGVDLVTTGTFVNSTTITLAVNASTTISAKQLEWGNDDTFEIQAAINECHSRGGGTIYFPNGIYLLAGDFVNSIDGVNPNSQIYFPLSATSETKLTIKLVGESAIIWPSGPFGAQNLPTKGVILKSIITGSATLPAVFGSSFVFDGVVNGNAVVPIFENICIMTKSMQGTTHIAPTMTAGKLFHLGAKQLYNCIAITESDPTESVEPVAETYGWYLSQQGHTDTHSIYRNVTAQGYYYGARIEEHDPGATIFAYNCISGLAIGGNSAGHAMMGGIFNINWCRYGITFLASRTVDFQYYAERWPGSFSTKWYDGIADVYFPSTQAVTGFISGKVSLAGGGVATMITSGAFTGNLKVTDLSQNPFPYLTTFGGKYPATTTAQGGSGWAPGDATLDPAYLEVNRGISSAGGEKGYAWLGLNHNNQTGLNNSVAIISANNLGSGDADKRLWQLAISTGGAIDAGRKDEYINSGTALVNTMATLAASHRFNVPVFFGGVATVPTARIHVAAGTATASTAPLKLTSGTVNTTPEIGAIEFDGTNYFGSLAGTRYTLAKTLTNTATLDFGSTAAGAITDLTITVTGAALGDAVSIGVPNGSVPDHGDFFGWVSATNTVTIRYTNNDLTVAKDPASGAFRASVIKY